MKRWLKWALAALIVVALLLGVMRALSSRKAQQEAVAAQAAQQAQTVVELGPTDVALVSARELVQGLSISGPLKAVNTALVKARVPGELRDMTVREGDHVQAGQVIARIDSGEYQSRLNQAQQQAQAAKAQVDIAKRSFENSQALVKQGFISATALETSTASLAAAQATYQAAQSAAEVAGKSLQDTVLRAPITGLISQRLAQPGERVGVEARIVEIVNLDKLELEASLSAGESVAVRVGQIANLQIEGAAKAATARVVRINPSAVAGSRAVLVYLALDGAAGLRQGLFAQGTLATGTVQALTVPLSTVRTDKPRPYVQLIEGTRIVHRDVDTGARGDVEGTTMVAVQGLAENTPIVAGSVGTLRQGTVVKVPAAHTPAGK